MPNAPTPGSPAGPVLASHLQQHPAAHADQDYSGGSGSPDKYASPPSAENVRFCRCEHVAFSRRVSFGFKRLSFRVSGMLAKDPCLSVTDKGDIAVHFSFQFRPRVNY